MAPTHVLGRPVIKSARRVNPTELLVQIKTKNLIGDELSPRLRSTQLGIPLKQHLRCSFVDFIDNLLRWRAE